MTAGTTVVPFEIDDYTRWVCSRRDDIGLTLRQVEAIPSSKSQGRHGNLRPFRRASRTTMT